ncbi:thioredoxin domain-containing protein [Lutibacter sp. TH_r2]|uniref:thioredoxin domain-containing protein n=1 Tax=Lutibacter sp. TH_r2 TaxID=3082083 RepID=UPI0029529738|nr:thioredoxin domain-containing protein [Lutibacter sp. TH_r2]MDV7186885.1 thioredoxin domain-containing protein [Lutibacter sp. TH_r2]
MAFKYTNSLINETSPYLLQHANNPVNWYAWNKKALELAKNENKLILISIGYSSCHWCHVMEHECFEDESVAAIMNQNFINIKVDREERPDIDQIYMSALQLLTGSGGWPLNCIALPNGKPFWGATYLPKERWKNTLLKIVELNKEKPEELLDYANKLTEGIQKSSLINVNTQNKKFNIKDLKNSIYNWEPYMDIELGGKLGAPKFPNPNNYLYLLRFAIQAEDTKLLDFVNTTLTKMALGGINDQINGGFSRYSVDKKWHVPHFEKMLYDNGQLVSLYSEAFRATQNPLYKQAVYETLQFIEEEFLTTVGAFYSSLDADSLDRNNELEEGAYYVWNSLELQEILKEDYPLFSKYYNINNYGFWEKGNYVLIRKETDEEFSKTNSISLNELEIKVVDWKNKLKKIQQNRSKPRLDDKSLTSWNALMLKGYIDAYKAFSEPKFLEIALKNAKFIYTKQLQPEGNLNHNFKNNKSTINGYLEDYATVIDAFITLYEVTFNSIWLNTAKQLTDYTFDHFFDTDKSMFYFTSNIDTALITRKMEIEDNVISSSNSIMANNLFKLSNYYSNTYYKKVSTQMLSNVITKSIANGLWYSNWLNLACNFSSNYYEIAIVGEDAIELSKQLHKKYIPNAIIAGSVKESTLPILQNRFQNKKTLIYTCIEGACNLPEENVQNTLKKIKIKF